MSVWNQTVSSETNSPSADISNLVDEWK